MSGVAEHVAARLGFRRTRSALEALGSCSRAPVLDRPRRLRALQRDHEPLQGLEQPRDSRLGYRSTRRRGRRAESWARHSGVILLETGHVVPAEEVSVPPRRWLRLQRRGC